MAAVSSSPVFPTHAAVFLGRNESLDSPSRFFGFSGLRHVKSANCENGKQRTRGKHRIISKMYVPDAWSKSPENRAAETLNNFFTYLSVRVVLAQLQAYNRDAYKDLKEFADRTPLKDGDRFLSQLMRESPLHKTLALRIIEVRSSYAKEDFEWDNVKKVSLQLLEESNIQLMRDFLVETSKFPDPSLD